MERIVIVGLVLLLAACGDEPVPSASEGSEPVHTARYAEPHPVQGSFSASGIQMPVLDVLALWTPSEATLKVIFLPTDDVTDEERREIATTDFVSIAMMGRASPDSQKWQWYPYAEVEMRFESGSAPGKGQIRHLFVHTGRIGSENQYGNLNYSGSLAGESVDEFHFRDTPDGGRLTLRMRGEHAGSDAYQWDVKLNEVPVMKM